jgi:hypothetical protein
MSFLRRLEGADEFFRSHAPLGVTDVRVAGSDDCVYVFVASGHTDDELTIIRLGAAKQWPKRQLVIAIRRAYESGEVPIGAYLREDDEKSTSNVG